MAAMGKRFVVSADEKLTAFMELEREIHEFAVEFDSVKISMSEFDATELIALCDSLLDFGELRKTTHTIWPAG